MRENGAEIKRGWEGSACPTPSRNSARFFFTHRMLIFLFLLAVRNMLKIQ